MSQTGKQDYRGREGSGDIQHRRKQKFCVFGFRIAEHFRRRAGFHKLAATHYTYVVAHILHHRQIVRYEQNSKTQFMAQIAEQVENTGLHTDIERADRFVRYQRFRFVGQGSGYAYPLTLPPTSHADTDPAPICSTPPDP